MAFGAVRQASSWAEQLVLVAEGVEELNGVVVVPAVAVAVVEEIQLAAAA